MMCKTKMDTTRYIDLFATQLNAQPRQPNATNTYSSTCI